VVGAKLDSAEWKKLSRRGAIEWVRFEEAVVMRSSR